MAHIIELNGQNHGRVEKLFREYAKIRFPLLVPGSQQWEYMRDFFYTGAFAIMGIISRDTDSATMEAFTEVRTVIRERKQKLSKGK